MANRRIDNPLMRKAFARRIAINNNNYVNYIKTQTDNTTNYTLMKIVDTEEALNSLIAKLDAAKDTETLKQMSTLITAYQIIHDNETNIIKLLKGEIRHKYAEEYKNKNKKQ